jgi:5-methylcytosine-specific restriction endonuclease McrA
MLNAKSICRQVGCNVLISKPGYCTQHEDNSLRFEDLKRSPGSRKFYGGSKWTHTARAYRRDNPMCADHLRNGLAVKGDLVDHVVERPVLISKGLNPYDFKYLQTLCMSCHNKKLRKRKEK